VVKPASKKKIVKHFKKTYQFSERTSCDLAGISRTGFRYQAKPKDDRAIRKRLLELATKHPSYGYLFLHGLMKSEGLVCNKKRTYRIYTEMGGLP
jgi:putative transposase